MSKIGKNVGVVIAIIIVVAIVAVIVYKEVPSIAPTKPDLTLRNYPELFKKDVIIVVGENATQIEMEGAQSIAYNLRNLTGNVPVIKKDSEITEKEKAGYNLILVGRPDANRIFRDVYARTNATKVTKEYPGAGKGVLEILRNPWNAEKAMLLIVGSDEWGVKVGSIILEDKQKLKNEPQVYVNWEEYTGIKFPIDTAEKAIRYAKTDIDVKKFIDKWVAEGFDVKPYAKFSNTSNNWVIRFQVVSPVEERVLTIEINYNGSIIRKGGLI